MSVQRLKQDMPDATEMDEPQRAGELTMTTALKDALRDILDNLSGYECRRFKHYLEPLSYMSWPTLEMVNRDKTVDLMVLKYGWEAGGVMLTFLQKMNYNHLASDLERHLEKWPTMTTAQRNILRDIMGELSEGQFWRFKHYLKNPDRILWESQDEDNRDDVVDFMVLKYGLEADAVMLTFLQKMNYNDLALDLKRHRGKCAKSQKSAASSSTSRGPTMTTAQRNIIRDIMGELSEGQFWRFKHYLKNPDRILRERLDEYKKDEIVDFMVQNYSWEAGGVMLTVLQEMNYNHLASDLERHMGKYKKELLSSCGAGDPSISQTACSVDTVPSRSRTNGCKSCEDVVDTSHWTRIEPSVSMETGVPVYKHSSEAGSFECTVSGLRWVCTDKVTLHYHFSDPDIFKAELAMLQYTPIGPLMDIKVLSGELLEAHLPHFACLEDSDLSLRDAVKVLHGINSSVILEPCELTRFHAKVLKPSFSLREVLMKIGIPVKVHLDVLIYQTRVTPLVLFMYVVPRDTSMIKAVRDDLQETPNAKNIKKHRPDMSIWMDSTYSLKATNSHARISPEAITLKYSNPPDLFQVVIDEPGNCFDLELISEERTIWKATLESFEYAETVVVPHGSRELLSAPTLSQEPSPGNTDIIASSGSSVNAPIISGCTFTGNVTFQHWWTQNKVLLYSLVCVPVIAVVYWLYTKDM